MPGCDFTRRDLLRWSAWAATAAPLVLAGSGHARATTRTAGADPVTPVDLELVTLTEDSAVIT
jgi:Icc protein